MASGNQPNYLEDLEFFHAGLSRNTAEALLLANGIEGTYLIRESKHKGPGRYAASVRCQSSVKHFEIRFNETEDTYLFGVYTFYSFKELSEHFYQQPVLGNDNGGGLPVVLRFPYKNDVYEPKFYTDVTEHSEKKEGNATAPDFHVGSKEGFLTKRGDTVKNWKLRWFVVQKDALMYYKERTSKKAQKVWNLNELEQVSEAGVEGKKFSFSLVFTKRTIYCMAESPQEVKEWVDFFQWKIDHFKKMKER